MEERQRDRGQPWKRGRESGDSHVREAERQGTAMEERQRDRGLPWKRERRAQLRKRGQVVQA